MLGKIFKGHSARKFNYIPRHYDKKNHDLIYKRIGDGRFASNYVRKKKLSNNEIPEDDKRIDLTSYRARAKRSKRSPQFNTFLILVAMLVLLLVIWVITNPNFTNIFSE